MKDNSKGKHPHIEKPGEEQIRELLKDKDPDLLEVYLEIHNLILEIFPEITYSIDCKDGMMGYGARQFGYDGWGMAALAAHKNWVSLMFMLGVDLEDPEEVLEGTGKKMRHIKVKSIEKFKGIHNKLERFIIEASKLNQS